MVAKKTARHTGALHCSGDVDHWFEVLPRAMGSVLSFVYGHWIFRRKENHNA